MSGIMIPKKPQLFDFCVRVLTIIDLNVIRLLHIVTKR